MTIWGTSYFVSFEAAVSYYTDAGCNADDVRRMLTDGTAHIGEPALKPNERLVKLDGGRRYGIADDGRYPPNYWAIAPTLPAKE